MSSSEKVVVIGASTNPSRYSYKAALALKQSGHNPYLIGLKNGEVNGMPIHTGRPNVENVDTVTMYVGPARQPELYEYILGLQPKRIIFNPGTENQDFMVMAKEKGIEVIAACTLVMLSLDNF